MDGTVLSLQPSGTLIVESSTLALSASQLPVPSIDDIDGYSVQEESSFAVVDGVTLTLGDPGATIAGSVVSPESGGKTLDVGSGRFAIPTGLANGTAGLLTFEGGQKRGVEVHLLLIFGTLGLMLLLN